MGGCGRSSASPHLDDPLAQAICRGPCACGHAEEPFPSPSPTTCHAFTSPLELARSARTQCLVGTTAMAHHCRWRSHFSGSQLTKEEAANKRGSFNDVSSPSDWITRAKFICPLNNILPVFHDCLQHCRNASSSKKHTCRQELSRATSFEKCISLRIPWVILAFGEQCLLTALIDAR